jgi:hypothetical protein
LHFNPSKNILASLDGTTEIGLFQKVEVQITVMDAGENAAQRSKLVLKLVKPSLEGMIAIDTKHERVNKSNKKRKTK